MSPLALTREVIRDVLVDDSFVRLDAKNGFTELDGTDRHTFLIVDFNVHCLHPLLFAPVRQPDCHQ